MKEQRHLLVNQPLFRHPGRSWSLLLFALLASSLGASVSPVWGRGTLREESFQSQSTSPSALVEQGKAFYQAERYGEAVTVLQQALQQVGHQEPLRRAMVLSNLSLAYQQLGQWSEVDQSIQESLDLLANLEDSADRTQVLAQTKAIQGQLLLSQGEAELALATWEEAAAAYTQVGNESGAIRSRINQAQALQSLGFYRRALKLLNEVEQTLQGQSDSLTKVVGLRSLGNALQLVGDLDQSRQVLEESKKLAQRLESPPDISAALFSLGNTARAQGQNQQALDFYQQAIAADPAPAQKVEAQLNQLGLLLDAQSWSEVQELLPQITSQLESLPPSRTAVYARINFAQSLMRLKLVHNEKNATLPSQLQTFASRKNIAQLLGTAAQLAESLADRRAQSYALGTFGRLYEQTNQQLEARNLTQQALVLAQAVNARDIAYQWQWQLGRLLKAQGDSEEALTAYAQAVEILKSLRSDLIAINPEIQFTFRESVEPIYRQYVGLLLDSSQAPVTQEKLQQAREAIDALQLAELENFFRATCLDTEPVLLDQVTDQNDPTAAVVYPIVLDDRFEVIVKLPQQPLRHYTTPIEDRQRVERILERLTQSLTQRNSQETIPLAQQVYTWLLSKAEQDLATSNVKTLVFVLDSPLRNIPMAVLNDGQQYLGEKYGIALTPGLQLLDPQPIARQQLRALAAGLSEARGGFSSLAFVPRELDTVQSQVSDSVELLNQEFTRTALQDRINALPFPVVHLATHGQFSSKAEETFILTWNERLDVNQLNDLLQSSDQSRTGAIELLVLSACETVAGDDRAALGLAGVAVRAGARSTLATLWRVNDEATAFFMEQFYDALADPEKATTKAEALRYAQLALLRNPRFARPHFWTPYVLVGNWL